MSRLSSSAKARVAAVVAATGLLSVAGGVAATAAPSGAVGPAGPVEKPFNYTCQFPLVGAKPVKATVKITFPDQGKVGEVIQATDFNTDVVIDAETVSALKLIGAASVEGTASAGVDLKINETEFGVMLNGLSLPKAEVPESGELTMQLVGEVPGLTVKEPGEVSFALGSAFAGKVTPRTADGGETQLGTFDLSCTLDEGQDTALATIPVS